MGSAATTNSKGPNRLPRPPGEVDRNLLRLVIKRLSSQVLLFSLGMAILLGGMAVWRKDLQALHLLFALLAIFGVAMFGYLFLEQRQKLARGDAETMSRLIRDSTKDISNSSSSLAVEVWTEPADAGPTGSRDISVRPTRSGERYRLGDRIAVYFRANRDCYLTLLNIGTSGKLTVLFPNTLHRDNFIAANQVHCIPGPGDDFEYQLQGRPGIEKLKAIATLKPVELLESSFAPDGSLFRSVQPAQGARDIAVIQGQVGALPSEEWAESEFEFHVA